MASQAESIDKRCPSCTEPVQSKWKCCPVCETRLECPSRQATTHINNLYIDSNTDVHEIDHQDSTSIEFGSDEVVPVEPLLVNAGIEFGSDEVVPVEPLLVNADGGVESNQNEANTFDEVSVVQALKDMNKTLEKKGFSKAKEQMERDLESWKRYTIKIAIVGGSGSGKSSFINAILGLDPTHEDAAEVGITETTQKRQMFSHSTYPNFEFWDLPGVGTPNFKKYDYLKAIEVERYDIFIVTSERRFSENDAWLSKVIDKRFYFVRTQIDVDLMRDRLSKRDLYNPAITLDKIRSDCIKNLKNEGVLEPRVFLVNNYEPGKYDFNTIFSQLKNDAQERGPGIMLRSAFPRNY
ncbi:hypothetical protein DPMN_041985 [Dreissena polymorpha]|uniref:IRG-type G domain-containing protein n=1 Tax=Dreissena polymorpha TaxID=45954 RepID=A0A9D4D0A5_DREPO|nr:hypothetical protein DPMN_041985 [Dreissena polymorpha]